MNALKEAWTRPAGSRMHHEIAREVIRCCLLGNDFTKIAEDSRNRPRDDEVRRERTRVTGSATGDERSTSWLRALAVLEILGEPAGAGGMGVVELARRLGRDK